MFESKTLSLLLLGSTLTKIDAERGNVGGLRRNLRTNKRDLYMYGTANIPNPTANPTPSPTISWLWNNDGWTDDVPEVNTDKPTSKPTQKIWGNDGYAPETPDTPDSPSSKKSSKTSGISANVGVSGSKKSSKSSSTSQISNIGGSSKKSSKSSGISANVGVSGSKKSSKSSSTSQISNIGGSSKKSSKSSGVSPNVGAADSPTKSSKGKSSSFASVNVSSSKKKSSKAAEVPISSISGSKSGKGGGTDSIEPPELENNKWNSDGYKPTNKPTAPQIEERKWNDDGWTPPAIETPAPTKKPAWNGDGYKPTNKPTVPQIETNKPTRKPTHNPTSYPTKNPTMAPTETPSEPPIPPIITELPTLYPTKNPTPSPTKSPTTPSPTICDERMKWHPNPEMSICTNDFKYPPFWALPENEDKYFYESMEECCKGVFGTPTCNHKDECAPTASPTESPSNSPTLSPVVTIITPVPSPSPTICDERMKWHPNPEMSICTNDFDYPPFWALPENEDKYFYESMEECCKGVFGTLTCTYKDECAPTSSPTLSPSDSPTASPIVTIVTPVPSPSPTSCEERKFHINSDGTMCSNGYDYPINGNIGMNHEDYDSIEECCSAIFGTNTCKYEDICNPLAPTLSPSKNPTVSPVTPEPTLPPTDEPTESPTLSPVTPEPTPSPTLSPIVTIITPVPTPSPTACEARKFYTNTDATMCSNGYDNPGSGIFYDNLEDCCLQVSGTISCRHEDICNPTPSPTIMPTASPSFGATPTVSKETTGPPTGSNNRGSYTVNEIGSNDFANGTFRKEVTSECRKVMGGNPIVCVYVCTEITSIFEGTNAEPSDEYAKTTESECPQ